MQNANLVGDYIKLHIGWRGTFPAQKRIFHDAMGQNCAICMADFLELPVKIELVQLVLKDLFITN